MSRPITTHQNLLCSGDPCGSAGVAASVHRGSNNHYIHRGYGRIVINQESHNNSITGRPRSWTGRNRSFFIENMGFLDGSLSVLFSEQSNTIHIPAIREGGSAKAISAEVTFAGIYFPGLSFSPIRSGSSPKPFYSNRERAAAILSTLRDAAAACLPPFDSDGSNLKGGTRLRLNDWCHSRRPFTPLFDYSLGIYHIRTAGALCPPNLGHARRFPLFFDHPHNGSNIPAFALPGAEKVPPEEPLFLTMEPVWGQVHCLN